MEYQQWLNNVNIHLKKRSNLTTDNADPPNLRSLFASRVTPEAAAIILSQSQTFAPIDPGMEATFAAWEFAQ